MSFGVDYSFSRPTIAALKAHTPPVTFVMRYLDNSDPNKPSAKMLTYSEARALNSAGIKVGVVFETDGQRASGGLSAGKEDASRAFWLMKGLRDDAPVFFAVDFQPNAAQMPAVINYFRGIGQVLPTTRIGAYGSFAVLGALYAEGLITLGWQTYAWSNGKWDARANLRQYSNGQTIGGAAVDFDSIVDPTKDAGVWLLHEFDALPIGTPDPTPTPLPPNPTPPPVSQPPVTVSTTPFPLAAGHIYGYKPRHLSMALLGRCHDGKASAADRANMNKILKRFGRITAGFFTPQLHEDVKKWQAKNGLAINGAIDAPTWAKLSRTGSGL